MLPFLLSNFFRLQLSLFWIIGVILSVGCATSEVTPAPPPMISFAITPSAEETIVQTITPSAEEIVFQTVTVSAELQSNAPTPLPILSPLSSPTPVILEEPILDEEGYLELVWEHLVPKGYQAQDIISKYQEQLSLLSDADPQAMVIYEEMQNEYNNAPVNTEYAQKQVKLSGFIAPLDYDDDGLIINFLLVPYFGACIHVPPPPVNQTIFISAAPGEGIKPEDSYAPIWVKGELTNSEEETAIGVAGYRIEQAIVDPY